MPSHAQDPLPVDASPAVDPGDQRRLSATGSTDACDPDRQADRRQACEALVAAYRGNTHRLLTDLADHLSASVAYVDRPTIEAHLERPLSDTEWSASASQMTGMAFDEHIGDAGTIRTDWIEDVLLRAGVPGRPRTVTSPSSPPRRRR
ncbi:hypothetical protein IN07_10360 [Modestobacter caceresii]|uniref:Uncharacterized protein n=1 Tax=Modestobacter caceresii TaxID=1522368 RepID=A0A098Y8R2_9ACTN|nr:hypothetical protein [Modestobacter caceresii]KGH46832.1 hypothetical protein IN07_10360 [Modestobacter caceresii]